MPKTNDLKKQSMLDDKHKRELENNGCAEKNTCVPSVVGSDRCRSCSEGAERIAESGLAAIPGELRGEFACVLGLTVIGACAAVSKSFREQLWESPEVWQALAGGYGLSTAQLAEFSPKQQRDAFRRAHFRTNGERLRQLGSTNAISECMGEAALVVRGLMPEDGTASAEAACATAELALRVHDPAHLASATAARQLLAAAQLRSDVILAAQLGRLESANSSAVDLRELIDSACEEHVDQLEAQAATALEQLRSEEISELPDARGRWIDSERLAEMLDREIRNALFYT